MSIVDKNLIKWEEIVRAKTKASNTNFCKKKL